MLPAAALTSTAPVLDRVTVVGNPVFDRGDHLLPLTHPVLDRGVQRLINDGVPPSNGLVAERDPQSLTTDNPLGTAPPRALSAASAGATLMIRQR